MEGESIEFEGKGFVIRGGAWKLPGTSQDKDLLVEVYVDDELYEEAVLPTSQQARRHDLTWKYKLDNGVHTAKIVWKNPTDGYTIEVDKVIIYGPKPSS
jgi:hypothetical protein